MSDQVTEIRIYVACLAAYNNGILHGAWIDAEQESGDIWDAINAMLKASPIEDAEEYAIHDYEGFGSISISEYHGINEVAQLAAFIAEHGELGQGLLAFNNDIEWAKEAIEDHYIGEYKSVTEYAEEVTEETVTIPQSLQFYIDYDSMARDMEINDLLVIETGFEQVHIFWNF